MKCRQNEIRGAGLGLRFSHIPDILQSAPPVKWWEVVSENYFRCGEKNLVDLERVRELAPFVFHGVGLNLGAAEPLSTAPGSLITFVGQV